VSRNIVTAFASIFAGRVTAMATLALSTPILIRFLGVSAYGQYATLIAVFNLSMILVSSGLNSGARKYLAEERDHEHWKDHVFGFFFRLAAGLALVAAIGFIAAARFGVVSATLGEELTPYFYLVGILAIMAQFTNYLRRSLMGLKLEHIAEPIRVAFTVTFAVASIALAAAGFGVTGVLVGRLIACAVVIVSAGYFLSKHLSLSYVTSSPPDWFPRRELFAFNYKTVVYIFLLTSLYHVDVIMLSTTVESDQVGYYKAALVLAEFLWFVPRAVQSTMLQSTSNLWAEGKIERINNIASKVTRYGLLFTALLAVGLAALAQDFVPLYYPTEFTASVVPLLLLLPGSLGFAIARPILSISHAKGELGVVIAATGAAAAINLGLNALLIPRYGMIGAAVATSIGYGSLPVFHVAGARYLGFDPFADARLGRIAATVGISAVPILGLGAWIGNPLIALLVVPPTGFLIYSVVAVATGAIRLEEVADLAGELPPPIGTKASAVIKWVGA
jgi:O-antigen/teichoic acid export membrane protein